MTVTSTEPLLRLEGLAVRYGGVQALAGIDLEVRQGELVALRRQPGESLLGGLLAGKEITDGREIHFLTDRLEKLKSVENSAATSKNRQ